MWTFFRGAQQVAGRTYRPLSSGENRLTTTLAFDVSAVRGGGGGGGDVCGGLRRSRV